jgi:redox-sensitive bicupin YhaK (pirin superfamily)
MNTTSTTTGYRAASRVFTAPRAQDGDGVELRRAFPGTTLTDLDPFLLLDQMGPMEFKPGDARGFPPHPHRGFETVTYLLPASSSIATPGVITGSCGPATSNG